MALIILQVTVPMLGFYVLDKVLKEKYSFKEFIKAGGMKGSAQNRQRNEQDRRGGGKAAAEGRFHSYSTSNL